MKKKLEDLIPAENITAYLSIYQKIHDIKYDNSIEELQKLNNELRAFLTKAKGREWITEGEKTSLWDKWNNSCLNKIDDLGNKYHLEYLKHEFKGKPNRPPENDINFLLYALYFDLRAFTTTPHYKLIVDFFIEKLQIYDFDYMNIRKRIGTIRLSSIHQNLMFYQDYFKDKGSSLLSSTTSKNPTGFLDILSQWFNNNTMS